MVSYTYPSGSFPAYKYVVILSAYRGKLLFSRHRLRTTWETQGGHIEPGETPREAAARELYEESGAKDFTLTELGDYWAGDPVTKQGACGVVFAADIAVLGALPESEIACVQSFDTLPPVEEMTYPGITPTLYEAFGSVMEDIRKRQKTR